MNRRKPKIFLAVSQTQKSAFIAAYEHYADSVYRFCLCRVSSRIAAEDLTQETFIRVWEYISSGREIKQIRAFLFEVCRNLIIDFYRKTERRKQEKSLDEMIDSRGIPLQLSYDARQEMESRNALRELLKIMESLSKGDQDILIMRFVEDFKPREIAQTLHINNKNASARIKRAVLRLNRVFNDKVNNQ